MKRFAYLLVIGVLSLGPSSAYGVTHVGEHGGMKVPAVDGMPNSACDPIVSSRLNVEDPYRDLDAINSVQDVERISRVFKNSTARQDDRDYKVNNQPRAGVPLGRNPDQANMLNRQIDQQPVTLLPQWGP